MKKGIKTYGFVVLDLAIVVLSSVLATLLRFEFLIPPYYYSALANFILLASIITLFFSYIVGSYKNLLAYFGFAELITQGIVTMFTASMLLVVKFSFVPEISGSITIIFCMLFFVLSSLLRGVPRIQKWASILINKRQGKTIRVLIVGAGDTGAMIAKQLENDNSHDLYPVAFVDDNEDKVDKKIMGLSVRGRLADAPRLCEELAIDEIIIAIPSAGKKEMIDILDKVSASNLPTKVFRHAIDVEKFMVGDGTALKEVSIEDLLFREPIEIENPMNRVFVEDKVIIVMGGVGSIGAELCRQVLENGCKKLIIFDIHENGLFEINEELKGEFLGKYITCLGSVRDVGRLEQVFSEHKPELVLHAAAHKHVPMMEINPFEAIKNNVLGTQNVIEAALRHGAEKLILISTDKAVHPTNVMGATKRMCELLVRAYGGRGCEMVAVRFGNVLESNGSVIPLFKKQIAKGGPVTVTHKDMTRYFMTIKEAVSLVLSAGAFAKDSELFVLDMGEPVKIYELATSLIRLSGKTPDVDIAIEITGLRPGEKLYEELVLDGEKVDNTSHKKIFILRGEAAVRTDLLANVKELKALADANENEERLRELLFEIIGECELDSLALNA